MKSPPKITLLIIALLSLLTLIIAGCITPPTDLNDCSNSKGQAQQNCYFEAKECSSMTQGDFQDSCYVQLAKDQNSTSICSTLKSDKTQGYCFEQIALQQKDKNLCAEIKDEYWKDNCYYNLGILENKEGLCYLITPTNIQQKEDCFIKVALAKLKPNICDFLLPDKRETCVYQVAVKAKEVEHCSLLQDPVNKESCKLKVAKISNNKEICPTIKIQEIEDICEKYFAAAPSEPSPSEPQQSE